MAIPTPETPILPGNKNNPGQGFESGAPLPAQQQGRDFLEENQKLIVAIVGGLIAIAAGIFLYKKFIQEPAQAEASEQLWRAQQRFDQDSFALAVGTPAPGALGFKEIAEQYSGTPAGNLANYYAGVSYLNLGQYDAAISYLKDFDADGSILPATKADALGNAYSQKGDLATAKGYYETAVKEAGDNGAIAPYYIKKLAMLNEREGNKAAANELYTRIQKEFPTSLEAAEIDKFIMRTAQ